MIKRLPHWCITDKFPAFYDTESATAIEQTAKLYGAIQEVIDSHNMWVDEINLIVDEYNDATNQDMECFKRAITEICNNYIKTMDMKIEHQDRQIEETIVYVKTNIYSTVKTIIDEMKDSGELDAAILSSFDGINEKVNELESLINSEVEKIFELQQDNINNKQNIETNKTNIDGLKNKVNNLFFDNVEDMKKSTTLQSGDTVQTLGYYDVNDGGKANYKIRDKKETDVEDGSIHFLNKGLVAELIAPEELKSIIFGDNESFEDSTILQKLINYASEHKIKCTLFKNKTYYTNGKIQIKENTHLDLNGSIIKMNEGSNTYFMANSELYDGDTEEYIENIIIENGTFDGNNNYDDNLASMVLIMYSGKNIVIRDLNVINCQRNPFNFFNSCDCYFKNIYFKNICLNESQYIRGGNYCISFEAFSDVTKNSNVIVENINVDNYMCGIFHFRNYTNIKIDTVKSLNVVDGSLKTIPLTFTNTQFGEVKNVDIDRVTGNGFEINQNSAFLTFENCNINNAFVGVVLGPNTDTNSINHDITFNNCKFIANNKTADYMVIYNYSDNVHFKNCYIDGLLGGGDHKASNYFIENSIILLNDWTKFYPFKCITIVESLVNNMKFKHYDYKNVDIEIPYELPKQSSIDIHLPYIRQRILSCALKISSVSKTAPEQNYQGSYLYNISQNSSDIGQLSEKLNSLGSQWRVVTPSIESREYIKLSTNSDVDLEGVLRLVS